MSCVWREVREDGQGRSGCSALSKLWRRGREEAHLCEWVRSQGIGLVPRSLRAEVGWLGLGLGLRWLGVERVGFIGWLVVRWLVVRWLVVRWLVVWWLVGLGDLMKLLDGKRLGFEMNRALRSRAAELTRPPGLAVVLVGSDPASKVYVGRKGKVAGRLGFHHVQIDLAEDVEQSELEAVVNRLNADDDIDGVLVQLPLPRHLDERSVIDRIAPEKDVDGLTLTNTGALTQGRPRLVACTPSGVMRLLRDAEIELEGKRACVIGRSNIVGRPMAALLEQANATVTLCHSRTRGVERIIAESDVVVAAVGRPGFVHGDCLKEGAVVIDVGINRLEDGSLVGDVDFPSACERAGAITPVPGGVGPMTIAMLMENTWRAACLRQGVEPTR